MVLQNARIGIRIGSADPYWVQMREAVIRQAQQLGLELIPVDFNATARSVEGQVALFEDLAAQDLDALICSYLPQPLVYRVLASGLPIIHLTETPIRHPLCVSTKGYYDIGRIAGTYLAEQLRGCGRVLVVGGGLDESGEDGESRIAGMTDVFSQYPRIHADHIASAWRYERAYPQIEAALHTWDQPIDAIWGLSDSLALAARDVAAALGLLDAQTLVLGVNGDPLALAAISEGRMTATIDTPLSVFGAQVVDLAWRAARDEVLPDHLGYETRLVTAANVSEIALQRLVAIADLPSRLVGVNRQQEQERLTQLEISVEINRRVGAILDRQQLGHEIVDLIRLRYGYDALYLWHLDGDMLTDEQTNTQIARASAGMLNAGLTSSTPIFIPDTHASARFAPDQRWPHLRSRVVVPIHSGGVVCGLLDGHCHRYTPHTSELLSGLQVIADQLGIALHNAALYDEALQARTAAERADQLKTRLLANVSHELRVPLNIILGYSQTALINPQYVDVPGTLRDDLQHIYRSGEHLARVMNDLLDLSQAEIGELELFPEPLNTRAFLVETFESIAASLKLAPGVSCRLELPDHLPVISADAVRLRQILFNLLSNAFKATDTGEIVLGARIAPPVLHLWVADTGVGIPPDLQERIFEPFVSAPHHGQRPEGVGLGLSIARRLVALHRGTMRLESTPGQGSMFHVELPLLSLERHAASALPDAVPMLLVIAATERIPAPVLELSQRQSLRIHRIASQDDVDLLPPTLHSAVLAWDAAQGTRAEWQVLQHLRTIPTLAQAPLLLYSDVPQWTTSIVAKPLHGSALLNAIAALHWPDTTQPVLIVDDDAQTRAMYRELIGQVLPNQPVLVAENGTHALALVAQHTPSLVILDLIMPEVDGFTVLQQLRAQPDTRNVPVVVLSGKTLSLDDLKLLDHPRVTFYTKDVLSNDEIMSRFRDQLDVGMHLPLATSRLVKHAIVYLQRHYTRELSRQEIADVVGVSKSYLSHIFQQELGLSPWEYLNRYRMYQAKRLLHGTYESITAVAVQVGFADASYFGRVFRKHVGCSPQEYREGARMHGE